MPKRWFFSAVQMLLADRRVETIVVTYASPAEYGDTLAENPDPIRVLPGFFATDGRTQHIRSSWVSDTSRWVSLRYSPT
jgi:hypothetical protein